MTASVDARREHQYQHPVHPEILPMSENPFEDFRYFYRDGMPLRPAPKRRRRTTTRCMPSLVYTNTA